MQYPDYKPAIEAPALSDDELNALDDLLATVPGDGALNIEMLDGYLTALLLAPTPAERLRGADWLPLVWGGDGEGDAPSAPFASGKQKKQVVVMVLRHLRSIDQALRHRPDAWEPVFSVAETDDGQELADAEDWCTGFLVATELDADGWGALFDHPQWGPLLAPLGLLGGDIDSLSATDAERLDDPLQRDGLSRAVPDAVLALSTRPR